MFRLFFVVLLVSLGGTAAAAENAPPARTEEASLAPILQWVRHKESVEMLGAILRGEMPDGMGSAWFHPAQGAYSWGWLVQRCDANRDGVIQLQEWPGRRSFFERLDRNRDGRLTAEDFDASSKPRSDPQKELANLLFRRADSNQDNVVTVEEWQKLFEQAAGAKKTLSRQQLQELLFAPPPSAGRSMPATPSRWTLLQGLLTSEIGSPLEGPSLGQPAPPIRLPTQDGKRVVNLRDYRGKKPVVLVFGSFT